MVFGIDEMLNAGVRPEVFSQPVEFWRSGTGKFHQNASCPPRRVNPQPTLVKLTDLRDTKLCANCCGVPNAGTLLLALVTTGRHLAAGRRLLHRPDPGLDTAARAESTAAGLLHARRADLGQDAHDEADRLRAALIDLAATIRADRPVDRDAWCDYAATYALPVGADAHGPSTVAPASETLRVLRASLLRQMPWAAICAALRQASAEVGTGGPEWLLPEVLEAYLDQARPVMDQARSATPDRDVWLVTAGLHVGGHEPNDDFLDIVSPAPVLTQAVVSYRPWEVRRVPAMVADLLASRGRWNVTSVAGHYRVGWPDVYTYPINPQHPETAEQFELALRLWGTNPGGRFLSDDLEVAAGVLTTG